MDRQQREALHRTSVAGNTVAGAVGVGFGAAKLRDAYKEEHPARFARHVGQVGNVALKRGVKPATVVRAARVARTGKPPFKALVVASSAGAAAAGAHRLSDHLQRVDRRKARQAAVAKSAFGVELGYVEKGLGEKPVATGLKFTARVKRAREITRDSVKQGAQATRLGQGQKRL